MTPWREDVRCNARRTRRVLVSGSLEVSRDDRCLELGRAQEGALRSYSREERKDRDGPSDGGLHDDASKL